MTWANIAEAVFLGAALAMDAMTVSVALGASGRKAFDWKKIILLRYYRDMTQQQVADIMGLTQVKVSREEKKIMAFMREKLC